MTTELSNAEFALHMRERRDTRPMLNWSWVGESRLYVLISHDGSEREFRMEKPTLADMERACRQVVDITIIEVTGEPNHNGNAWLLRVEYSARDEHEFERLVL